MTNVAAQERVQAYAGMSVETVKAQGSEGQKLMVSLFDKIRTVSLTNRKQNILTTIASKLKRVKLE